MPLTRPQIELLCSVIRTLERERRVLLAVDWDVHGLQQEPEDMPITRPQIELLCNVIRTLGRERRVLVKARRFSARNAELMKEVEDLKTLNASLMAARVRIACTTCCTTCFCGNVVGN